MIAKFQMFLVTTPFVYQASDILQHSWTETEKRRQLLLCSIYMHIALRFNDLVLDNDSMQWITVKLIINPIIKAK